MKSGWQKNLVQFNVCVLSALLVFVQTSVLADPVSSQPPIDAGKADLQQTLDNLNRAFDALEAVQRDIPRDTFDPEAALDIAGLDVKDVFQWVRDNTWYVPYQGALRGAIGVLMDRTGNSLDRALLLNELLHLLGYQTRLARAQLTQTQVEDLKTRIRPIPPGGTMPSSKPTADPDQEMERYANKFGLDLEQLKARSEEATRDRERLTRLSAERIADQSAFLLEKIGPLPETALANQHAQELTRMQDHWWLQYQDGANWVSLDPTLPDAEIGQSFSEPDETRFVSSLSKLDENMLHSVRIRVVLECWYDGGLHEETLLESPFLHPSELLGKPLTLEHIPVNWPADLNLFAAGDPRVVIKTTALSQDAWAPALRIGSKTVLDRSFTSGCDLEDASRSMMAAGKLGSSVANKLGGFEKALEDSDKAGQDATPGSKKDGQVTAQWIEYQINEPGRARRTMRRQTFDLLDSRVPKTAVPDWRQPESSRNLSWRLSLLGQTEILLLGNQPSPDFGANLWMSTLIQYRRNLAGLVKDSSNGEPNDSSKFADRAQAEPWQDIYAIALGRRDAGLETGSFYLDQINIIARHRQLKTADDGSLLKLDGYDIVANDTAFQTAKGTNTFSQMVSQGVRDTVTEALWMKANCGQSTPQSSCQYIDNTSELFLASKTQGISWIAVDSTASLETAAKSTLDLPAKALERIRQELAAGYTVVVPVRAITFGEEMKVAWWRIDPESGVTLGMTENGWGGTMAEYAVHIFLWFGSLFLCAGDYCSVNPLGMFMCTVGLGYGVVSGFGLFGLSVSKVGVSVFSFVLNYLIGTSYGPGLNDC